MDDPLWQDRGLYPFGRAEMTQLSWRRPVVRARFERSECRARYPGGVQSRRDSRHATAHQNLRPRSRGTDGHGSGLIAALDPRGNLAVGRYSYFLPFPARLGFDPAAASRRRLPILKRTARMAGIFRLSPVRRLRPRRALRS